MSEPFQLYRYTHADGSAKDWAWRRRQDGSSEVRWGRAGQLSQSRIYPASRYERLLRTVQAKLAKGYVDLGIRELDAHGRLIEPQPEPQHAPSVPTPPTPDIDLSALDSDIDDDWF
ncbi:hypothetical protein G3480_16045 [Thiorhodococcus mannitoliphagus]|uniref:WGR domain-containing protein n=1 Tax=Thiorhodococcus mannitoliphagus TaxID=329406 RepID=A0A6P1DXK5_9GAMM|nr:hypothetical protein [Thiorhodococcus mannitoliphagus]NEX21803.1 hypothetical protein [Thiorhodococcus mannitoliphagus]